MVTMMDMATGYIDKGIMREMFNLVESGIGAVNLLR